MKKLFCLVLFVLYLYQYGLTQQTNRNERLERDGTSIFIVENGKRYLVDRNVITVKLKPEVHKIRKEVTVLRSNCLGYIDISVPEGIDIEDFVTMLERTDEFEIVEYNGIGELYLTPNDTRRTEQWYLNSINAYSAWDITMGSSRIIVAVLDTGTDWMHAELGNGTDGYSNVNATLGWNYLTNNNNVISTNDHGTRVSGILGAKTNNSRGIAGISGGNQSSGITVMPMVVINAQGEVSIPAVDDAIIDAVNNGARVINMSFGGPSSTALDAAIAYAIQKKVVLVAASGNDPLGNGLPVNYPASHKDVIAVGAINQLNNKADFSNYGTNLDVVAPGVDILSTTLNNDYNSQDGTSFAAPQVAGIAALIFSVRPDLDQAQVRHAIESTCKKITGSYLLPLPLGFPYTYSSNSSHPNGTWNQYVGHGLVNAYAAVYSVIPRIEGPVSCFVGQSVNFTLYNPPASYSWTCSNNLTPGSASGDTKSFTANNYGYAWVAVYSGSTQVAKYDFYIYNYAPSISYIDGPDYVFYNPNGSSSPSTDENYTVVLSNTVAPPYSYSWGMEGDPSYYSLSQNGNTVTVSFKIDFDWSFKLYVNAYNSYGSDYAAKYITFKGSQKSGTAPKVYPNPVYDILNVEIDQAMIDKVKALQQNSGKSFNADPVFDIRFYNGQNVLLRKQFSKGGTVQFNVSGLPDGIYYLHIYDGLSVKPEMFSVIVRH